MIIASIKKIFVFTFVISILLTKPAQLNAGFSIKCGKTCTLDSTVSNLTDVTCAELVGRGNLSGTVIMIKADKFLFTGSIECSEKCVIVTKEPFDHSIFTQKGSGIFEFKVEPDLTMGSVSSQQLDDLLETPVKKDSNFLDSYRNINCVQLNEDEVVLYKEFSSKTTQALYFGLSVGLIALGNYFLSHPVEKDKNNAYSMMVGGGLILMHTVYQAIKTAYPEKLMVINKQGFAYNGNQFCNWEDLKKIYPKITNYSDGTATSSLTINNKENENISVDIYRMPISLEELMSLFDYYGNKNKKA